MNMVMTCVSIVQFWCHPPFPYVDWLRAISFLLLVHSTIHVWMFCGLLFQYVSSIISTHTASL